MLIILGGLPGVGKTTIARELARQIGAVYVRIDSIEQAISESGALSQPVNDAGYRIGYAIAEENLRLGRTVIADSVNPIALTRDAWVSVATRVHVRSIDIEVTCSDATEHRRRVETRKGDIPGLRPLSWEEVVTRDYQAWDRERIQVDTAGRSVEQIVKMLRDELVRQTERQRR
jgi:predicted kinase